MGAQKAPGATKTPVFTILLCLIPNLKRISGGTPAKLL